MHLFLRPYRTKTAAVEKPLRGDILSKDLLEARALELAQQHSYAKTGARGARLRQRFRENTRILNEAYFSFAESARNKEMLAAGAEWLLDNFHVIDEQVRDIRRDLPKSYYQALPKLTSGEWKGFPRVYQIVCDFISHTDSIVEIESLTTFINAYQSITILGIGEIWAVPIMLRLALVENLRRLAQMGIMVTENRRAADRLCKDILDENTASGADLLIQVVNRVGQNPAVLEHGASHILRRVRAKGAPAALTLQWLDEQLRERGIDPNEIARLEQRAQASDQISVGNSVTALKTIGSLNWRDWFERVSVVDAVLTKDPAGVYGKSDFFTRDMYRHRIERLARRIHKTEVETAEAVVAYAASEGAQLIASGKCDSRALHVGYYLIDEGYRPFCESLQLKYYIHHRIHRFLRTHALQFYLGGILSVTLLGVCFALAYSHKVGAGGWWYCAILLLLPWPLSEWGVHFNHWFLTKFVRPRPLPKYNYDEGIPDTAKTAVVVQTLLGDLEALERAVQALEIRYIGNQDPNFTFGLLADFFDSTTEHQPGDVGLVHRAQELLDELNTRYCPEGPPRFFAFFRDRVWNPSEKKFMGWERKRGKIEEFNRYLRGKADGGFQIVGGSPESLSGIKYVITLDSDTRLPPGTARKLVATIDHPLNRPIFDESTGTVVKGYSIIQPRVGITLQSANASKYAEIFSGHTGLDPYTLTVSDIYQDVFSEGSYIGKGIYNVDSFERALTNRFPENSLLSHDLIEGLFARCGLASDIEVFDDFPMRYHAQARRQHRWMRGDWQLLPWIGPRIPDGSRKLIHTPFSGLSEWKLFDNLRRTLIAPSLMLTLVLLWCVAPGSALVWFGGVAVILGFPIVTVLWRLLFEVPIGYSMTTFLYSIYSDFAKNLQMIVYSMAFLPHTAVNAIRAIAVTLYRLFISKRRLLEWETAEAAEQRLKGDLGSFGRAMSVSYWLIIPAAAVTFATVSGTRLLIGLFFLTLWALAPLIAWWLSLPKKEINQQLSAEQREYLRKVAFSTWRYFDSFLVPEYNFLIPDNLQIVPQRVVAERTSPTNISLSMLSVISANDLGFTPLTSAVERLAFILEALGKLETFHGHFLNWYGIRDLRALPPRYVSTVDSGNLVGHFIAVMETMKSYPRSPFFTRAHVHHILTLLSEEKVLSDSAFRDLERACSELGSLSGLSRAITALMEANESLTIRRSEVVARTFEEIAKLEVVLRWVRLIDPLKKFGAQKLLPKKLQNVERILTGRTPTLSLVLKIVHRLLKIEAMIDVRQLEATDRANFDALLTALREASDELNRIAGRIAYIATETERHVREADFKVLFDSQKKLFVIGYNIDSGQRDNSFYDLLASEARLASYVAIAKGDVPQTHWFLLNRALTDSPGGKALLSWGGTMFEYLMPILVMRDFPSTLLSETYSAVVRAQRLYGLRRGIPWGISESAYSGVDFEKTYQYRAFGIPGLGLKRGLAEDLVLSPYSTAMAVVIDPLHAIENLKRLEEDGVRGEFGFYEAVDYTPDRLGAEERRHVVKSFLAHHQGMSLVSINNLLNQDVFQNRFHADPAVKARELLLQERFPTRIPVIQPHQAEVLSIKEVDHENRAESMEVFRSPHTRYPYCRVLSNRNLSAILDNAGGGGCFFRTDIALTRFREDGLDSTSGSFVYVRDLDDGVFWSTCYQPTRVEPESYEAVFNFDKVEYKYRYRGISTLTEVTVSPEDNVEVRRITVSNLSSRLRRLELTSYGEVALASVRADSAHPAFSKMFIQSEYLEEYDALVFVRLPRSEHDKEIYMMHLVSMPVVWAPTQFETSREKFIGRGGSILHPAAMQVKDRLSGSAGCVLDPVFSLRNIVEIDASDSLTVSFITAIADTREEILQLVRKYREGQHVTRAFEMAWSHSDVEIRHQQISRASVLNFQRLANALVYNIESLRAPAEILKRSRLPQSALWRFGISGDEPIVLLVITDPDQSELAEELLLAHEYLRLRGVRFDLVILNEYQSGYYQDLQEELEFMVRSGISRNLVEQRGGVYLRSLLQLSEDENALLQSVARVALYGSRGSLTSQLNFVQRAAAEQAPKRTERSYRISYSEPKKDTLEFPNGAGGFVDNGKSYRIEVTPTKVPPQPWVNVVANPNFGFLVSESGAGYTWADNSRENRITSWSNDPICDPPSEVIYIRDQDSGEYWCPTPKPSEIGYPVNVTHSFGSSRFDAEIRKIGSGLEISGAPEAPVKWWLLDLHNRDSKTRNLEVFLYIEWVLGVTRQDTYRSIRTGFNPDKQFVYAVNPFNIDYSEQVVFLGSNLPLHSFTTNRREFIGRLRNVSQPIAFEQLGAAAGRGQKFGARASSVVLSGTTGGGFDSCAVLKVQMQLGAGEKQPILFYLSKSPNLGDAEQKSTQYRSLGARHAAFKEVKQFWSDITETIQVRTPSRRFDVILNGWLQYQTLACRMFARSGFYQSSGAIGFRDQLQDSMALMVSRPQIARDQILLHASHQFPEGDVQHWWHPPSGRGIRTRISDNYLWLPYVVDQYILTTGDASILDAEVNFIEGPQLEPEKHDSYFTPSVSSRRAPLYEHCLLALDRTANLGPNGIPLMGGGDWNDGMNEVGPKGKGESIWLGWFTACILRDFSTHVESRGDAARADRYRSRAQDIARAIEQHGWDGSWYRRAFFDDGTPMGSAANEECQIDAIAQSWSIISKFGDVERTKQAMDHVDERLVDRELRLLKLLWPPFHSSKPNPGYIQSYPRGLRENGGQYTHGVCWTVLAATMQGNGDRAFEYFDMLNPISHGDSPEILKVYRTEPYVTCGDVYTNVQHPGRGGWSWYTGSSGWLYRVGIENIAGLKVSGDSFAIDPCVPRDWKEFEITLKRPNAVFRIVVKNPGGVQKGVRSLKANGAVQSQNTVKISDFTGEVLVEVEMG